MNLQRLRYLFITSQHEFNITRAAAAAHLSQPGISKQLVALERELGIDILIRRGNRIVGLTDAGKAALVIARRVLTDVENLNRLRDEFSAMDSGRFVIATTHTHARYVLPEVIRRFRKRYPAVQLTIRQENAIAVARLVTDGEADIGLSAEPPADPGHLVLLPCYRLARSLIMPPRHPLARTATPSLPSIGRYPIIALQTPFTTSHDLVHTLARAGIVPTVAMTATDVDVIKAYVELGIGIAVVPSITIHPTRDRGLVSLDVTALFQPSISCMIFRRNHYLLPFMLAFVQYVAPHWTSDAVARTVRGESSPLGDGELATVARRIRH